MAKNDQEEAYEKALSAALGRTLDMVKFAETKNAALLTFNSALILGSVNLLTTKSPLALGYDTAFTAALPLFGGAAVLSVVSFAPKLSPTAFFKRPDHNRALNLLFFGDVASIGPDRAHATFRAAYEPDPERSATDRYLADLAEQLAINGGIANRKFGIFAKAAWLDLLALIFLAVPALWAMLEALLLARP